MDWFNELIRDKNSIIGGAMNPLTMKMPDGLAEYIILVAVCLFIAFLWFKDKFKPEDLSETDRIKNKAEADNRCALASSRVDSIKDLIQSNIEQRKRMEEDLQSVNKILIKIVEDNTRAMTMLCDRLK